MTDDPNPQPDADEIVDADVVDEQPAPPPPFDAEDHGLVGSTDLVPSAAATTLIEADGPDELIEKATRIATSLDRLIAAQGLRVNMGSDTNPRWHVEVEGWQTLGTLLGCVPILRYARQALDPETGRPAATRYTARVEHFTGRGNDRRLQRVTTYDVDGFDWEARVDVVRNGVIVGQGEGLCSRKEARWGRADDYACKSMAITRATSRAYKQAAGWVVALAGYQTAPAAEVDPNTGQPLLYGPDSDGKTVKRVRDAILYLHRLADGPDPGSAVADEVETEAIEDVLTKIHGEVGSPQLPYVIARSILHVAAHVKHRHADARAGDEDEAATS